MSDTFKGIVTADGKKRQLPYGSLLDLPSSDPSLTVEGGFADAAVVGKKNKKTDEAIASLKEELDDYQMCKRWWMQDDTTFKNLSSSVKSAFMKITDFTVKTYLKDISVYIYGCSVSAEGDFELKVAFAYNGVEKTFGWRLPASEDTKTITITRIYGKCVMDFSVTYSTQGNRSGILLKDTQKIYINVKYTGKEFGSEKIDNRIVNRLFITDAVKKVEILRMQNCDTAISGSTFWYYNEYRLTYSDDSTKTFIKKSTSEKTGIVKEYLNDDAIIYVDSDVLAIAKAMYSYTSSPYELNTSIAIRLQDLSSALEEIEKNLSEIDGKVGELDNTVNSLTCAKKWWKNNQVIPRGLLNISNIEFYGIFADCDLSIYNVKVNADGSFSLAFSYFDYYNRNKKQESTYGVTLPVSEEYKTKRIDLGNGRYINFTYRTKGNKIGKILGEEEHIYVEYETKSNALTQEDHVVDYRAFRECHVSNSVTKVTIKRIQNIDTSISGSTYPYYALYQVEYKDGTSNIFERYSETLLSGLQTEIFDNDVVLIFDADVIGYYKTGFQERSIDLCEKGYVRDIETATETEEDLFYEYNLFDYDFISLLNDVKEIKMTNGASAVRDISHIAKGKKYCYRLGFPNTGKSDIDFELPTQSLEGLQEVVARIYVSSLEGITDATAFIVTDYWDSTIPGRVTLKEGVNEIRITLADKWHIRDYQDLMDKTWSKIKVRLSSTKANIHAYLLDIVSVKPQKAKILFIDDHAYKNFMDVGYPQLKALKIPVTWGVKIESLNKPVQYASRIINEEEVESLASDSYSEINFHSYSGIGTSSMSADECRDDVAKAQRWLRKRGLYREPAFRSAWVQNKAKNARATDDMLDFSATYTADETIACFPFKDNHNIPRVAVHYGKELINLWFNALKLSHGIMVIYTHDISDLETSDPIHCSAEKWNYFISKLTGAINEGWLEGVTMSGLMTKYRRTF
nr:MAG TPA: hypothetical protein [Caudoviricetes sp.]